MFEEIKNQPNDRTIWFLVGVVALCVLLVLVVVFNHDKEKPRSPQGIVAAAFNNTNVFSVKEWKPGMGSKPFMYHPAASNSVVWRPLPSKAAPGALQGRHGFTALPPRPWAS
ncbi:MAG: hypothetical protein JRJ51_08235 [Deltaproteobacteria bacterium]|jgi:hypothetical protein|nr:hypothetical protein [Deltaproteobacteria bacterium]